MSRELALSPSVIASMQEYLSPDYTAKRQAIANWKEVLLYCYFFLIAAASLRVRAAISWKTACDSWTPPETGATQRFMIPC